MEKQKTLMQEADINKSPNGRHTNLIYTEGEPEI